MRHSPQMMLASVLIAAAFTPESGERAMVRLINEQRASQGLSQLRRVHVLDQAARWFADDLAARDTGLDHVDSHGRRVTHRIYDFGYRAIRKSAENIAYGSENPKETHERWMNSTGHRRNLLDPDLEDIGVGARVSASGRVYWVTEFGLRHRGAPALALTPEE